MDVHDVPLLPERTPQGNGVVDEKGRVPTPGVDGNRLGFLVGGQRHLGTSGIPMSRRKERDIVSHRSKGTLPPAPRGHGRTVRDAQNAHGSLPWVRFL